MELFGSGGKFGTISVNFEVGETPEGMMKVDGNTKISLVDKKTALSTKLESNKIYKGIKAVAKGEDKSHYLKFDITMDKTMPEREGSVFITESAESILHEPQHVRIDRQTLQTQGAMQFPYYQHQDWMKPATSSWYQEQYNFYIQNQNYWKQDYARQRNQGKISNVKDYINNKIDDFVN